MKEYPACNCRVLVSEEGLGQTDKLPCRFSYLCAEIAALTVGDLHQNRGYDSLRVIRKGGRRDALAINPQTAGRLRAYLERAGHREGMDGPMFRPLKHNGKCQEERRRMGSRRDRSGGAQACGHPRPCARLLRALDARDFHHHGARKRCCRTALKS